MLNFLNVREVYSPEEPASGEALSAPEDMVEWFKNHPYLDTGEPEPVNVGGASGVVLDAAVASAPEEYPSYRSIPCVPLFHESDRGSFVSFEGYKYRVVVLDAGGEAATIVAEDPADQFDEFLPEAERVFDTVKWRD